MNKIKIKIMVLALILILFITEIKRLRTAYDDNKSQGSINEDIFFITIEKIIYCILIINKRSIQKNKQKEINRIYQILIRGP